MQARSPAPFCLRGLVLLELLVAGCVLALLVAMAAPSFAAISARLKVRTAVEALTSGIYTARAEAYKRGGHVTFAPANADGCNTGTEDLPWSCGWVAFADEDEDGKRNESEEVLFVGQPPADIDIAESRGTTTFKLDAWGKFNGFGAFGFSLQSRADKKAVSAICVSSGGRVQTRYGKDEC